MEKVLMKGNEALAEAMIRSGCRFYSGYPITPQNEILEYLSQRMPEAGGTFIQSSHLCQYLPLPAAADTQVLPSARLPRLKG